MMYNSERIKGVGIAKDDPQSSSFKSSSISHTGLGERGLLGTTPSADVDAVVFFLGSMVRSSSTYSNSSVSRGGPLAVSLLGSGGGGMSAADPN